MILTYLALRKIMSSNLNEYYVSLGLLSYALLGKQVANQLITNSFITGLNKLIETKYVTHIDIDQKRRLNEYIVDLSKFQIQTANEYYSAVCSEYIKKILELDYKEKMALLHFYCYLVTTIMKSGDKVGAGFTPYEIMAKEIGLCRQTISKYMDKLEEENIIYIYRSSDAIYMNGIYREIPNVYGDINDTERIINIGKTYEQNYGGHAKKVRSARTSTTRSASAKFALIKKEYEETGKITKYKNELQLIYEIMKEYNERYKLNKDDSRYKDISIFKDYDFYREEDVHNEMSMSRLF